MDSALLLSNTQAVNQRITSVLKRTFRAGCEDTSVDPEEGDVRLVPFNETATRTALCDDVHFGAVELFREGLWGRICAFTLEENTIDAQVVCRHQSFPFGTVMDSIFLEYFDDHREGEASNIAWASNVRFLEEK